MNNFTNAADLIDEPNDTFTDLLTNDEASRLFLLAHNDNITQKSINASPDDDESVEEEQMCRICRGNVGEIMKTPCLCRGSVGYIHDYCLKQWMRIRNRNFCEICKQKFEIKRKRNYGKLICNFFKKNYFTMMVKEVINLSLFLHLSYIQSAELYILLDLFIKDQRIPSPSEIFFPTVISFTGIFNILLLDWSIQGFNEVLYKLTYLWNNDCIEDEDDDDIMQMPDGFFEI